MKRLVYIILLCIVAVSAIVAQTSASADIPPSGSDSVAANDSLDIDSVMSDSTLPDVTPVMRRGTSRRPFVAPVNNAATRTQYVNDAQGDSARMLERRRQRSTHYHDETGKLIMVDTVTGQEWIDSTLMPKPPKMKQPLLYNLEFGVNVWDALMRAFGQKYGIIDFSAAINLHNRYIPTFELGLGTASNRPSGMNFTYKSPLAPYFKIGADYNFIYNSDPDYRFFAGVRYGFSAFSYRLVDATFDDNYWGQSGVIDFPSQNIVAGWMELALGLRVKIVGPVSAGWMFRFHTILHRTKPSTGNAWYIPGYGSATSSLAGSFYVTYTLPFKHRPAPSDQPTDVGSNADALMRPDSTRSPQGHPEHQHHHNHVH